MTTYQYTDDTNTVVQVIADDGVSRESMLAAVLPKGTEILPADQPSIDSLKRSAKADIDAAAGTARSRYITVAPGQEATYLLKSRQARDYQVAGYMGSVPELVQSEMDAAGDATPQAATDRILAEEAAWVTLAATIERQRRAGKIAVDAAADEAAVYAARDATIAALSAV